MTTIGAVASALGVAATDVVNCAVELDRGGFRFVSLDWYTLRSSSPARLLAVTDADAIRDEMPRALARWQERSKRAATRDAERITTAEAAQYVRVKETTIRQWARRGYLTAVGRERRSTLYRRGDVSQAAEQSRERTRKRGAGSRFFLYAEREGTVTTAAVARIVGVEPATIRQWVSRGRLQPIGVRGRSHLFRVQDVLDVVEPRRAT